MSHVAVKYQCVDNIHIFSSQDEKAKGLCAASYDLKVAYLDVANQLKILFRENHGEAADFGPALPIEEFQKKLDELAATKTKNFCPMPAAETAWDSAVAVYARTERKLLTPLLPGCALRGAAWLKN